MRSFYRKLNFNFIRDIAPVSSITRQPQVMAQTHRSQPSTIPEIIDYAKANPGQVNFSSTGIGSISHLAGELFKMMAGVNLVHVPFSGQRALALPFARWTNRGFFRLSSLIDRVHQDR